MGLDDRVALAGLAQRFHSYNVVRVQVLPESRYLNGHLFNRVDGLRSASQRWRSDGVVVHYSWTLDPAEKLEKIEKFGLA